MAKIMNKTEINDTKTNDEQKKSSILEMIASGFRLGIETGATTTAICIGGALLFGFLADTFNSRKNKTNQ